MKNIPAPDFSLTDMDGNTVNLSDLKGQVVVLDFWATWCRPCIASFPAMQKAMEEVKNDNVRFLFVNTFESYPEEERIQKIKEAIDNHRVEFNVVLDEKENNDYIVSKAYGVRGIPAKFIIDKSGTIRFLNSGFGGEEKLIDELRVMVGILNQRD